jgi:hypothetical protein
MVQLLIHCINGLESRQTLVEVSGQTSTHILNSGILVHEKYLTVTFDGINEPAPNNRIGGGCGFQTSDSPVKDELVNIRAESSNNTGRASGIQ